METLEKLFDSYKGIVLFYIIIALMAFLLTLNIKGINSQSEITDNNEKTYYA